MAGEQISQPRIGFKKAPVVSFREGFTADQRKPSRRETPLRLEHGVLTRSAWDGLGSRALGLEEGDQMGKFVCLTTMTWLLLGNVYIFLLLVVEWLKSKHLSAEI